MRFQVLCTDKSTPISKAAGASDATEAQETLGEVRLKKNKLSFELLNSVRKATLQRYHGAKKALLKEGEPVDCEFELYVLSLCCNLLKEFYLRRFKTSIRDDRKLVLSKTINYRTRFAVTYRLEGKEIITSNLRLFELLMQILARIHNGDDFKLAYLKKVEELEDEAAIIPNRKAVRLYLQSLHHHMQSLASAPNSKK